MRTGVLAATGLACLAVPAACATVPQPNTGPEGTCDSVPPDSVGTFQPIFLNPEAVGRALTRGLNRELDRAEEFGRSTARDSARVRILVDERGRVADTQLETSTGEPESDLAVRRAVRLSRFRPGTYQCKPTRMWITWTVMPYPERGRLPAPGDRQPSRLWRPSKLTPGSFPSTLEHGGTVA